MVGQPWRVAVHPELGGRWSSLRDPSGHEWLWSRPDPARSHVRPGDRFVDVGGLEECLPTIGGEPDHGDVWARPWRELTAPAPVGGAGAGSTTVRVDTSECRLTRTHRAGADGVEVQYLLEADPGWRFVWAAHVLLEPREGTRVMAPHGHPVLAFPGHGPAVATTWPAPLGQQFDVLGPDDGSAMFVTLPGLEEVVVDDAGRLLRLRLELGQGADGGSGPLPQGIGLWRNLGGYPWDAPAYRNFGVEPMIGRDFRLDRAGPDDSGVVPPTGRLTWSVRIDRP